MRSNQKSSDREVLEFDFGVRYDWFFVTEVRVRLWLGDRIMTVEAGEAAEFATMTPHAFAALDGPAELITIFDRDGQGAHVHR